MKKVTYLVFTGIVLMGLSCNPDNTPDPSSCTPASINLVAPVRDEPCTSGRQEGERFLATFDWVYQSGIATDAVLIVTDLTTNTVINPSSEVTSPTELFLDYDRNYRWEVTAQSCSGEIQSESWEFTTTGSPRTDTAPQPADIEIVNISNQTARINWTGFDEEGGALTFVLFVDQNPNPVSQVESFSGESGAPLTHVIREGIIQEVGVDYYVRIETTDQRGNKSNSIKVFRSR